MPQTDSEPNIRQAVPFFAVTNMENSVRFYVDGLGCTMTKKWVVDGHLRWCWLKLDAVALMLQEYPKEGENAWVPQGQPGQGVTISFQCRDALAIYHAITQRGLPASRPFVGNGMWVTGVVDPDGYKLEFESPTDAPEDSELLP